MTAPSFEFVAMKGLLRLSAQDPKVQAFFGGSLKTIKRDVFLGWLEFKSFGVYVSFKEAEWLIPAEKLTNPKTLHLCGFSMFREGFEGYAGYSGDLPNNVSFADCEAAVISKMGEPETRGGGSMSRLLGLIHPWIGYRFCDAMLHFQFDLSGLVERVSLFAPDIGI